MGEQEICRCSGIRYCKHCIDSDRVQAVIKENALLTKSADVISKQYGVERTSSCSFAVVGPSRFSLCPHCNTVFPMINEVLKNCEDHKTLVPVSDINLEGLFVVPEAVSVSEEKELIDFFDNPSPFPPWKLSQSGRRKQDFGPKANFKKQKLKPSDLPGMPKQLKKILEKISFLVEQQTKKEYCIVEASVLEYTRESNSSIDPHVDDTWVWGNRIAGLNMLEDTIMTFINSEEKAVDLYIPRGAFFLLSDESRYNWMHGIRLNNIKNRRVSITFRELSEKLDVSSEVVEYIKKMSLTFV
ncbi:alkylated DNA repair protein alkB like protein 4 [Trypanosoma theileri]|uniref:Alkylated DNA repair protein alkB like protein 4 n=1 Tax=Trypanosoma theileri TaxID=67003 RepID=A0A1X0P7R1_9TRYP|nr:alkylated DNA repair protein alkB like protein 4 [Trypanosoma theileri]ORC92976.1 alkylated DNA repair protein alkB like protein 4 [Trypanosoma theileri]